MQIYQNTKTNVLENIEQQKHWSNTIEKYYAPYF